MLTDQLALEYAQQHIKVLEAENQHLREALEKIKEPTGAYSRNKIEYLKNVIESQVDIACKALKEKDNG